MADARPLAAVMVGDPTPLTLANLERLSTWCDLLLSEATVTHRGEPRTPLRGGWRDLLGLPPAQLRVYTMDPPQGSGAWLEGMQRNGVLPALVREPPDRPVLLADVDELLDATAVLALIAGGIPEPCRLGLVPLYGAMDRVALSIHCCWKPEWAELRHAPPKRPYRFHGPVLATVAMLRERSAIDLRRTTPFVDRFQTFGVHATFAGPIDEVIGKLQSLRHVWVPRVMDPFHLSTMLSAGVHHAGWWIANHREPEPWLTEIAHRCGLRLAGPSLPTSHLAVLRSWAEARLDPDLPDDVVKAVDVYVANRDRNASDFLTPLDAWQHKKIMNHWGHVQ